jgi:hypothetical protein
MTMHLVGPYLTTTNYKKRKTKMTKARMADLDARWREHTKWAKRHNLPKMTFDEYLDYISGRVRVSSKKPTASVWPKDEPTHRSSNHRELYPSLNSTDAGVATKPQPKIYTGDKLLGIATMHKSNMVPIFSSKDAEDVAKMRR